MGYKPEPGKVSATPEEIATATLESLKEDFADILGGVKEDATLILSELQGGLSEAIVNGDKEAIKDYEVILSGVLEANKIKAAQAAKKAMLTVIKGAAGAAIKIVTGFNIPDVSFQQRGPNTQ